jgi:type IV pilus assembly protein PilO
MTVTRKWSLLALLLVLAISAAGWFLLISPKRSEAADLRGQTATQEDANARLEQKIQVLMAQQEELPRQRARLALIRSQIPDNPALPALVRDLTAAGRKVGASIDAMSPSLPVAAAPAAQTPVAATSGETAETAPAAPTAALYQVPLNLEVSGSYFELEQFVNKLEGLKRSFLVTGFTLAEDSESEVPGDLKLSLQGRVFLSPEVAAAPATTGAATTTGTTATTGTSAPAAQ